MPDSETQWPHSFELQSLERVSAAAPLSCEGAKWKVIVSESSTVQLPLTVCLPSTLTLVGRASDVTFPSVTRTLPSLDFTGLAPPPTSKVTVEAVVRFTVIST